uniref:Uncharacterized protein n=1 Tax=Haptolina brevifila TaxID=156173 RepID=A0A7S2GQS2_9EUKA
MLFSVAFHEIIRQVSVHCLERGYLMGKIWWSEMELFQRLLQLYRRDHVALEDERTRFGLERAGYQGKIDNLQRELDRGNSKIESLEREVERLRAVATANGVAAASGFEGVSPGRNREAL